MKTLNLVFIFCALFTTSLCYLEDINNAVSSSPTIGPTYAWWVNWMLATVQGGVMSGCFFLGGWTSFWFNDGGYWIGYCMDKFLSTSLDGSAIYFTAN